jgi:hypothetical protein
MVWFTVDTSMGRWIPLTNIIGVTSIPPKSKVNHSLPEKRGQALVPVSRSHRSVVRLDFHNPFVKLIV